MKNIAILGSTGTIGMNTLDVVRANRDKFKVYALSAKSNLDRLKKQVEEFAPQVIIMCENESYEKAKDFYKGKKIKVLFGDVGLCEAVSSSKVNFVMAGMVGAAGLNPFMAALEAKKTIGLANKEVLVMAGEYLHKKYKSDFLKQIIPVDSEHSAIFQCLQAGRTSEIESIILTASGGPFREREDLDNLTVEDALNHPNWKMGHKISIDSATLINKGFELIEAYWLFPIKLPQIQVVVHPQSIIHSMVEFVDGSIIAHLGVTDMRIPIQYALSYPERIKNTLPRLKFSELKKLTFHEPDYKKFRNLELAMNVIEKKGLYPAALNASNEIAVANFINKKINFKQITECNACVVENLSFKGALSLDNILKADNIAREEALKWISQFGLRK